MAILFATHTRFDEADEISTVPLKSASADTGSDTVKTDIESDTFYTMEAPSDKRYCGSINGILEILVASNAEAAYHDNTYIKEMIVKCNETGKISKDKFVSFQSIELMRSRICLGLFEILCMESNHAYMGTLENGNSISL